MFAKTILNLRPGQSFKFISEAFLKTFPACKDQVFIFSSVKAQGGMFLLLVNGEAGCQKFRLRAVPEVEIIEADQVLTLGAFLMRHTFSVDRPASVRVNLNGVVHAFTILPDFWDQNARNQRLCGLLRIGGVRVKVPSSAIVLNKA